MLWSPFPRSYFVACGLDNTCKVHCACYSEGTKVFIVIIAIQLAHSSWLLTYGHLANILSTHTQCSVQSLGRPLWKVFIPCVQREASHCTGCDWPGSCGSLLLGQRWNPFLICGSGVDVTVTSQTIYQLQREKMPGCAHTKVLTANSFLSSDCPWGFQYSMVLLALWLWSSWLLWLWRLQVISRSLMSFQLCRIYPYLQTWDIRNRNNPVSWWS